MISLKEVKQVKDSIFKRCTFEDGFKEYGYRVLTVPNGAEALKALKTNVPALILLDLMMPVMDGFQFREAQLSDPKIKAIPTVVMSADGHIVEKKARTGALDYLKKPLDIFKLLEIIEKFAA